MKTFKEIYKSNENITYAIYKNDSKLISYSDIKIAKEKMHELYNNYKRIAKAKGRAQGLSFPGPFSIKRELFEEIYKLREKKDHIVNKIPGLSNYEKRIINIRLFARPDLEPKINWNNWRNLTIEDFDVIFDEVKESKGEIKKRVQKDLASQFNGTTIEVWYNDNNVIFASPKSYKDMSFLGSPESFGVYAKSWCISRSLSYWNNYTQLQANHSGGFHSYCFIYNKELHEKYVISVEKNTYRDGAIGIHVTIYSREDKVIGEGDLTPYNISHFLKILSLEDFDKKLFKKILIDTVKLFEKLRKTSTKKGVTF